MCLHVCVLCDMGWISEMIVRIERKRNLQVVLQASPKVAVGKLWLIS